MKSRVNGERNLGNALGKPALSGNLLSLPEQFRSLEPVVRERIRSRRRAVKWNVPCVMSQMLAHKVADPQRKTG